MAARLACPEVVGRMDIHLETHSDEREIADVLVQLGANQPGSNRCWESRCLLEYM